VNRPFVGRNDELQELQTSLAEIGRDSAAGRLVLLSGPPGIGKTRTVEAFLESAGGGDEAWAVATLAEDATLIARTAIASKEHDRSADGDAALITRLQRAAAALPDHATDLRVQVLACLANETARVPGRRSDGAAIAREAVALARCLGEPKTLTMALRHWYDATWSPDTLLQRSDVANELLALGLKVASPAIELEGLRMRIALWLEVGNVAAADRDIAAFAATAAALGQSRWSWWVPVFRGTRALMRGRFADAQQLAHEAIAAGQAAGQHDTLPNVGSQLLGLRVLKGDLDANEIKASLSVFAKTRTWNRGFAAAEAYILSEAGVVDEAREVLVRLAAHDFADFERDSAWPSAMSFLARACAAVDASHLAPRLYDLLLPYAGRTVGNPSATFCFGVVDELLGLLAACSGRWSDAYVHFDAAIRTLLAMDSPPFVATATYGLAQVHAQAPNGDRRRARALAEEAGRLARELGMATLAERTARLLSGLPQPTLVVALPSESTATAALFQQQDRMWRLHFAGTAASLRDSKGMAYVRRLLERPGQGVHVVDLFQPTSTGDGAESGSDAWRDKRRRVVALQAMILEAEEGGDPQRAALLRSEILGLAESLASGLGRSAVDPAIEAIARRARWAVTKRIKDALKRISQVHPPLGDHLSLRIRTGTICRYVPDPREPVDWQF